MEKKKIKNRVLEDIIFDLYQNINEYIKLDTSNISIDELKGQFNKANNSMLEVLHYFIDVNHFKDQFDYSYYIPPMGFHVIAKSKKTKTEYSFILDKYRGTISLESYIHNFYNIKNLQDDFLIDFFNQSQKYGFSFIENFTASSSKSEYPDLFKTFKGSIFRMMRNYFFGVIEEIDGDFGFWSKTWTFDEAMDSMFIDAPNILKSFYKFNYNLWKIEDLKNKKYA